MWSTVIMSIGLINFQWTFDCGISFKPKRKRRYCGEHLKRWAQSQIWLIIVSNWQVYWFSCERTNALHQDRPGRRIGSGAVIELNIHCGDVQFDNWFLHNELIDPFEDWDRIRLLLTNHGRWLTVTFNGGIQGDLGFEVYLLYKLRSIRRHWYLCLAAYSLLGE